MTMVTPTPVNGYITLPVTVDPNQLLANALDAIAAQFPGWVPREGHLEVAILEQVAQMCSETAAVAAQVPVAIFAYFGSLVGITPLTGVQATAPVTFTMVDTRGYTIPAGTVVAYNQTGSAQILFTVQADINVTAGNATGTGTVICETVGTFANGLAAASLQMVTTMASVSSVATTATTSGGVDAETTTAYINRLSNELQLLAPRPILPTDFAALAVNVSGVYRALAIDQLIPARTDSTGVTVTNASTTVSDTQVQSYDQGRTLVSSGTVTWPANTTISSVTPGVSFVASAAPTVSGGGTASSVSFADFTGQARCCTVAGVDSNGAALTSTIQANLLAYLQAKREANFLVFVISPTSNPIDVSVQVKVAPGYNASAVQTAVQTALQSFLSPANWAGGNLTPPVWNSGMTVVRFWDVVQAVHNVPGVLYVSTCQICAHGGTLGSADVTMTGDAPLPAVGTLSVTVS